ncbi:MAG: energy-coupling factor transporter transmembrane protein EcfT [Clostridiales bacterium]|jgi:energy-coupling factor transport system permease protein|nr:energy-coupling factor transporter transmembrane protein EcfT [Clostridiales bacterium]
MRDVSIGQYYQTDSVIHRLDPRVKLVLAVAYIVMIFFIVSFIGYALGFLFILILVLLSRVPPLQVLRSLRMILFLIIFTFVLTVLFYRGGGDDLLFGWQFIKIYKTALINASKMALRIMLLVLGPSVLTLTTTPVELTDALERLLWPLAKIKLPVHELAIIMSIALRLIPTLVEETDKIISAQKARCAEFDSGNIFKRAKALLPVLIPLFVSSFRRADELAFAMDSRCYRGAVGRTRMKVMRLALRDLFAVLGFCAVFFAVLLLTYNWFGFGFIPLLTPGGY